MMFLIFCSLGLAEEAKAKGATLVQRYGLPKSHLRQGAEYAQPMVYFDEHTNRHDVFVGSSAEQALLRIHRTSGSVIQRIASRGEVQGAPVQHNHLLFWGDAAGWVYAYDIQEDVLVWERDVGGAVLSSLVLHNEEVYFSAAGDLVYSLSKNSGELNWRYEHRKDPTRIGEFPLLGSPIPLIVADTKLFVGFSDGAISDLSLDQGAVNKTYWVGEGRYPDVIAQPAIVTLTPEQQGILVSGFEGPTMLMNTELDQVLWSIDQGAAESALVTKERIILGGSDGKLTALDTTGAVLWSWDSETDSTLNVPVLNQGRLWVSSTGGTLYLIDPAFGDLLWSFKPKHLLSGFQGAPTVIDTPDGATELLLLSNKAQIYRFTVLQD